MQTVPDMPYPWQIKQWRQVRLAVEQDRLAHAILLNGVEGSGIRQFALEFTQYLLCEAIVQATACGKCSSCLLFNAGSHPDIKLLNKEVNDTQIKVDAVRDLITHLQLSSQYGRYKIAIIEPAEDMNRHAANSLLKTLEEPSPSTLLILVSYQPAKLPVTIRSRCQKISFNQIDPQLASDWLIGQISDPERTAALLDLAEGAPLTALELNEGDAVQERQEILADLQEACRANTDPVKIAEKWQKHDVVTVLNWLLFVFSKIAAMRCSGSTKHAGRSSINDELGRLANGLDLAQTIGCYDLTLRNYHLLTSDVNLNKQSLLEEVIVHWQSLHPG